MNVRLVVRAVAAIVAVSGLAMSSAVAVAWAMGDTKQEVLQLATCAALTLVASAAALIWVRAKGHFRFREGFAIVALGWVPRDNLG